MLKPTDPDPVVPKMACPSCGSPVVNTASKTIDASSYWRCRRCGEIWNIARRQAAEPYAFRHR